MKLKYVYPIKDGKYFMVGFIDWDVWKHPEAELYLKLLCDENFFEMEYHGSGNIEGDLVLAISSTEDNFDVIVRSLKKLKT